MCLAVTCYLHFWQNDQDLLCATVVTRGWNECQNNSQHRKLTVEKKNSLATPAGTQAHDLSMESSTPAVPTPKWMLTSKKYVAHVECTVIVAEHDNFQASTIKVPGS